MQARSKGLAILLATLLLGMVLGGLLHGYVQRERFRDALRLARPPQLVADIERAVQPRDDGQREAIRDILQATMQRMQQQRHSQVPIHLVLLQFPDDALRNACIIPRGHLLSQTKTRQFCI